MAFSRIHTKERERHQQEQKQLLVAQHQSKDIAQAIIGQIPGTESANDRFLLQVTRHCWHCEQPYHSRDFINN